MSDEACNSPAPEMKAIHDDINPEIGNVNLVNQEEPYFGNKVDVGTSPVQFPIESLLQSGAETD